MINNDTITYIKYEAFTDIPINERKIILRKFGISSGTMRRNAKHRNPKTVVAYDNNIPVGWSTLVSTNGEVNVFVTTTHRKRGIGSKLFEIILGEIPEDRFARVYPYNKASYALFNKYIDDKIKIIE